MRRDLAFLLRLGLLPKVYIDLLDRQVQTRVYEVGKSGNLYYFMGLGTVFEYANAKSDPSSP